MAGMIWFQILETRPPDVVIRAWRTIRKSVMIHMGTMWHKTMLPEHFKPNARYVYKYRWRSKKWQENKQKAADKGTIGVGINLRRVDPRAATDSLTLTGTLRDNVTRVAKIQAFETRFKLVMPGTSYTPSRPKPGNPGPHLAAEVTTLLQREKKALAKSGEKLARQMLNDYREQRQTTIKG